MLVRAVLALAVVATVTIALARTSGRRDGGWTPATWHELAARGTGHGPALLVAGAASLALVLLAWGTRFGTTEADAGVERPVRIDRGS